MGATMSGMWRSVAIMAALFLLSGCGNIVRSEVALFSAADEGDGLSFRPGVWIDNDSECKFDERLPVVEWPACADPVIFGPKGLKDPKLEGAIERVAVGDPLILQIGDKSGGYSCAGMEIIARDGRGRATALRVWPAMCGPPPVPASDGSTSGRKITQSPLPGLEIRGEDCIATEKAAVRRSAKASKAWAEAPMEIHWAQDAKR